MLGLQRGPGGEIWLHALYCTIGQIRSLEN
jgi:hypothetical protein